MTAWQKEQLGVKCIYCWRAAFCTTVTWNREAADCDLRCALRSSQSCGRGCQLCSPPHWHTAFITASVRHGESSATAACRAQAENRADPSPGHGSLGSCWCNGCRLENCWKAVFSNLLSVGGRKKSLSCRILTLNIIIIIRDQPWLLPVTKFLVPLHGFSIKYSLLCKASLLSNTLLHVRHLHYQLICYFL